MGFPVRVDPTLDPDEWYLESSSSNYYMERRMAIGHRINDRWIRIPEDTIYQQLVSLGVRIWKDQILDVAGKPRSYLFGGDYAYPYSLPLPIINKLAGRLNQNMTWYKHYNDEAIAYFDQHGVALNQAAEYWEQVGDKTLPKPTITPVELFPGTEYVAVIGLFHLPGTENGNNHHLYIDLIDQEGNRIYDPSLFLQWGWEGISQDQADDLNPVQVDKPDTEPGANIGLTWGQVVFGFGVNSLPSDKIKRIHIRYGNDGEGNNQGHHSHYVVLQKRIFADIDEPPIGQAMGTIDLQINKAFLNTFPIDEYGNIRLIVPIYR